MNATDLQRYLHEHIPLSKPMAVSVVSIAGDSVVLGAPLAPNINHRDTVFGGSASALAILTAWSLLHTRLSAAELHCRLVIQRNTMEYELPIAGAFTARASIDESEWSRFERTLMRRGKARITTTSVLEYEGRDAGRFVGEFVGLVTPESGNTT